ncbi:NADH-ubiquinone/plastoquinone oxidoreductase chain 6 [Leptospira inadai serovar Lyme str. 10]|uniref:NADH-quinone oxidoreductase subunit J n=2 Tax=Leptospira inadai serovar Lyme TaxID=293084 RepID=V6HEG6_9LEPT|nr:NADH-quinone oxidoreductase subunit J [Leptospira inadai]EQA38442.1 NADH-ubiquinone/plastoquinone oxidoreductase chain 6 [Leptospira inadai serovar Lyme str. 10]PNV71760.1 NADH-quinone oxidoreductase subunit C [Leptospira inadai serovar Lyme]
MVGLFDNPQLLLFFIFSGIIVAGALGVVFHPNPITSAILLVLAFFALSGIYAVLGSVFVATMQVFVYAGAIMVLVVFVLMLLSLHDESVSKLWTHPLKKGVLLFFVALLGVVLINSVREGIPNTQSSSHGYSKTGNYEYDITQNGVAKSTKVEGNTAVVGTSMFLDYLLPFEALSILLLAAVLGAVILGKKNLGKKPEEGER